MGIFVGIVFGLVVWFFVRYGLGGFYTIGPSERAVLTSFGRAQRLGEGTTLEDPVSADLRPEERARYAYPQVHVIAPGFYWKFPWQQVHRASIATATTSVAFDPENSQANQGGTALEAVTKDQLNIGLTGQLRFTVAERNLYAYLFGVKRPVAHVMAYFVSILRDRIANFSEPGSDPASTHATELGAQQISINDLRKHLRDLNERMNLECASAAARYGISLDAALITGIDPPSEVDSALAAINTAYNHVSSEISLAQASADQNIVMSRRAVEIETLNAQAEVQPILTLANELAALKAQGEGALRAYIRNARLVMFQRVESLVLEQELEVK
jgi:regulator of protease activity HflC (stomatin/prohibitin superfamily)